MRLGKNSFNIHAVILLPVCRHTQCAAASTIMAGGCAAVMAELRIYRAVFVQILCSGTRG
jgi:hypothetical protein